MGKPEKMLGLRRPKAGQNFLGEKVKLMWTPKDLLPIIVYEFILDQPLLTRQPKLWQKHKQPKYDKNTNLY